MRIIVMIGTRPEAIKMAPVVISLRATCLHEVILCASGQHREIVESALAEFGLMPDIFLSSPPPAPDLSSLTTFLLHSVSGMLAEQKPDWLLVQGDTTTVMTSAMAAFYQNIKVGHVEAGLRSFDMRAPFPEEVNRKLTSQLASLHFAPTEVARQNLFREGVADKDILVTGNTIVDALEMLKSNLDPAALPKPVKATLATGKKLVLVTCHRRENFGQPLRDICAATMQLAINYQDCAFIWPVHPNPNVKKAVMECTLDHPSNLLLLEPLPYIGLLSILSNASLAISDSGGIQEEAPSFGCPVLVLRDKTERPEGVNAGVAKLVGADEEQIIREAKEILEAPHVLLPHHNPYGDGHAAERIARYFAQ